jgi:CzcA family heavy metal efflux pump
MLAFTVRLSLRHPVLVVLLAVALLVLGTSSLWQAQYDVFPEFVPAQAEVQTEAEGLAAEQVEQLVTQPLENTINGAPHVVAVRSESSQGLSVISVVFDDAVDPFRAREQLAQRLNEATSSLPPGVKMPTLGAMTSSTMDLLKVGFVSDRLSPTALRTLIEWSVRPRVLGVSGVARALVFGGETRELVLRVKPEKLAAFGLSLSDVVTAARSAAGVRGAGFVDTANQRVVLEMQGQITTPRQWAGVVVVPAPGGHAVTLSELADVDYQIAAKFGDARIQGKPGVLLATSSQYGANTLDVTLRLEAALSELQPLLDSQGVTRIGPLHRPATFIQTALRNMREALIFGAILVVVVLMLFLRDWRSALISFVTIPLSLLIAVLVIGAWGWTINTMTLGGLAVALGVVVDDAIIDVENILRRLREARLTGAVVRVRELILQASMEVRRPIVLATLVVGLVFVPILFLPGLQGRFFAPLAAAFVLATFASLLVALSVAPALCWLLLRDAQHRREPRWQRRLKLAHRRVLRAAAPHAVTLLAVSLLAGAAALAGFFVFGDELMPAFREGHFVVQLTNTPGTSLEEMMRIGARVSGRVVALPDVATVSLQAGRASSGEDTWGPERGELHIELKPGLSGAREEAVQKSLHALLQDFPGLQSEVLTFLGDRISESISGEAAPVAINLFGGDLDALDDWSGRIATLLKGLPGAKDVHVNAGAQVPTVRIRLDAQKLAAQSLRASEVLEVVGAAYSGTVVNQVYADGHAVDVRVQLAEGTHTPPERIAELALRTPDGRRIALRDVAAVDLVESRSVISHDGARRRQVITAAPAAADTAAFTAQARTAITRQLALPAGMYVEVTGTAAEAQAARAALLRHSALAALAIGVLLVLTFAGWRSALLVLANVPFALLGGVLAVALSGASLSMGSLVGFVTLFGISARNAIMLLSHYEHLVIEEGATWHLVTALRGARERLTPILMTALVTALALLPLALGNGEAGREIEGPMAIVILGGLASSTLLNLLLLPVLAARFLDARALSPREESP